MSSWQAGPSRVPHDSSYSSRPNPEHRAGGSGRGGGAHRGRGGGSQGQGRGGGGGGYGRGRGRGGPHGGHQAAPQKCSFKGHSALSLLLHKADRHLIYPEGGLEELKRHDPMWVAEERERARRQRQKERSKGRVSHPLPAKPGTAASTSSPAKSGVTGYQADDNNNDDEDDDDGDDAEADDRAYDGPPDATIAGLNIQLDSPELIAEWINQRKKRWPTRQVVEQKLQEKEERQKRSELIYGPRFSGVKRPRSEQQQQQQAESRTSVVAETVEKRQKADTMASTEDSHKPDVEEHSDSDGAPEESDDDQDEDDAPEELSSKATAEPSSQAHDAEDDRRPVCRHFLQGRCNYGDRCRKRHPASAGEGSSTQQPQSQPQQPLRPRRPHPRPPPSNPFEQPDLLRQLLRNEIEKHVDAVGQAIRFVVDNDMLLHVETEEGQAEEQRRRRQLVQQPVHQSGVDGGSGMVTSSTVATLPEPAVEQPLVQGGMHVTRPTVDEETVAASSEAAEVERPKAALYRPASPDLRPLSELKYPPEPDPLIFLDPLRRDDPKPLLPTQLVRVAKDSVIRSILTPSTAIHPHGHKPRGLERAIVSLDALPTEFHRNAALEMILGVSGTGTPGNPAGLIVTSKDGRRKITESDLFRMGLRVGGDEVLAIKKLADRLTFLLDSSLQLDQVDAQDWSLLDADQREEARRAHYSKEADRLDRLRKLGIDV
ncbi:hypothetical protein BCV70DRAFT_209192 [Testicularia cyperi]|uniref:C3H1-type domain-containing protein n=1 Tax=Testicularia cyperi TaxID=1882483 RepID=A0A317XW98_9BASI|nr:hypothetical protein BCV70DRAFT_209192 [Testicularia cyperi]